MKVRFWPQLPTLPDLGSAETRYPAGARSGEGAASVLPFLDAALKGQVGNTDGPIAEQAKRSGQVRHRDPAEVRAQLEVAEQRLALAVLTRSGRMRLMLRFHIATLNEELSRLQTQERALASSASKRKSDLIGEKNGAHVT